MTTTETPTPPRPRRRRAGVLALLAGAALPFAPLAAIAQEQGAQEQAADSAGQPFQTAQLQTGQYLDRIVVTATRSARALRHNIGNIAALEAEELDLIGPHHASEALNRMPGVNVQRGSQVEHNTAIRSPVLVAGAGQGSFLYLEEGVPMRAAGFGNVNALFDANDVIGAGVEVVRGPGGALYGSNAVHGMINFLVRSPATQPGSYVEAAYGSFDRFTARGWTSQVLDDEGSGYFIGLSGGSDGGWRTDSGVDQQKVTARVDFNRGDIRTRTIFSFVNINQETAGYVQGPDAYKDRALSRINTFPEAFRDIRAWRWSTRIDWNNGGAWTLSATPFARKNEMSFLQHFLPYQGLEDNGHWSVGSQFAAYRDMANGQLILGLDTEYTKGYLWEFQQRPSFGAFPQGVHYDYDVKALVLAPYAHLEYQLTDRLRLETGLRLEMTDYDYTTNAPTGINGRFNVPADRSDDYQTLTPNIGLAYDINASAIAWVRYVRGARAPQTSDLYRLQDQQTVGDIKVETLDSIEAGVRGQWGLAAFELVGFAMDKRNFFFRDADGLNVADGKTRHVGLEVSGSVPLGDQFTVRGAATLARHTYRFTRTVGNFNESITRGDDMDTAPHLLAGAQLVWTPTDNFLAELAWTHVSSYYTDAANTQTYPGHDVFDLRAQWHINDTIRVFGAVRNLFDKKYAERADFALGNERYFPGEPRGFMGGLGLSF